MRYLLHIAFVFVFASCAFCEVSAGGIFSDNMVLQREMPCPVWGWADPGQTINLQFADQKKSTVADKDGRWQVTLDAMPASKEGRTLEIRSDATSLKFENVLVGEVWLCAGQSNMARTLGKDAFDYSQFRNYPKDAEYPEIRFFSCPPGASDKPLADFPGDKKKWTILSSSSANQMMSIPFFFAKLLAHDLNVPVGMIQAAVSGTPLTTWMSREALESTAAEIDGLPGYAELVSQSAQRLAKKKGSIKSWEDFIQAEEKWKVDGKGKWPGAGTVIPDFPTVLYNTKIHPLEPLAIRGVLWHQGEGGPLENYKERLLAMVADWRKAFGQDFYFIWGSLSRNTSVSVPLSPQVKMAHRSSVNEQFLLASQATTDSDKMILVNFVDLGNSSVHWGLKEESGLRMGEAALTMVYGKNPTIFTGPELESGEIKGKDVILKFRHIGEGLVYEPSIDGISGFIIESGSPSPGLYWADVKVSENTVVLSNPNVDTPINAYYSTGQNPHETLFNKEGFPAYPFRLKRERPTAKESEAPFLVELINAPTSVALNLNHVRRNGYIFYLKSGKKDSPSSVKTRIRFPKEWKKAFVRIGENTLKSIETQVDESGYRYADIEVPSDLTRVEVFSSENPPDFSGIDRW
ncbi:MAG: sialate O-acetylesterase [Chthoniobacterales bacterium]